MKAENEEENLNIDELLDIEHSKSSRDINYARHMAEDAYDAVLYFKLQESGSTDIQMAGADFKSRFPHIRKRKLKKLKSAILDLDDDLCFDLNTAKQEIGIKIDVNKLPISNEDRNRLRRALGYKGLIDAIDHTISKIQGRPGRSDLAPFYAAAPYLLHHFELVHGKVTASVQEDISVKNRRSTDVEITKKDGSVSIVRYSPAIRFLCNEFRIMAEDDKIKHSLAKTVIEKWLKRKLPPINVTF